MSHDGNLGQDVQYKAPARWIDKSGSFRVTSATEIVISSIIEQRERYNAKNPGSKRTTNRKKIRRELKLKVNKK